MDYILCSITTATTVIIPEKLDVICPVFSHMTVFCYANQETVGKGGWKNGFDAM